MSEKKEVFIATSGSYSDYEICAVFSTREKAEAYLKGFKYFSGEIEVWELDPPEDQDDSTTSPQKDPR